MTLSEQLESAGQPKLAAQAKALELEVAALRSIPRAFDDVRDFNVRFRFSPPESPALPPLSAVNLRKRLIQEEMEELFEEMDALNVGAIAQEAADLLYVTYGVFVIYGIRPQPIWDAIHAANMLKIANPDGGKVIKPPGWQKPNISKLVAAQIPEPR